MRLRDPWEGKSTGARKGQEPHNHLIRAAVVRVKGAGPTGR